MIDDIIAQLRDIQEQSRYDDESHWSRKASDALEAQARRIAELENYTDDLRGEIITLHGDLSDLLETKKIKSARISELEAALDDAMTALIKAKISDPEVRDAILGKLVWQ